jgi:hypothetical protein
MTGATTDAVTDVSTCAKTRSMTVRRVNSLGVITRRADSAERGTIAFTVPHFGLYLRKYAT